MKKIYTQEHYDFFRAYVPGHTLQQTIDEFNRRFNIEMTPLKAKSIKQRLNLKCGTPRGTPQGESKLWPRNIREFVKLNNYGKTAVEMAALINQTFSTNYTPQQIKSLRVHLKIKSGLTGHFAPGHVPCNKGKKGTFHEGCQKGWFKKGNKPHNYMPPGSEAVTTDGYLKVKIADPKKWQFKHILVWEKHFGKVPANYVIAFKDGNKLNCQIDNLICIPREVQILLTNWKMRSNVPQITETGVKIAKLYYKAKEINQNRSKE